jgi:hypothetical protein
MTEIAIQDRVSVIETVDAVFDAVDAKDWDAAEALFADKVRIDFTSLADGEPADVTNVQLVDGWRVGLHVKKQSFHTVGNYRLGRDGDVVTVGVKGYAYNLLADDLGGGMWEVWGHYDLRLERVSGAWKATALTFDAWHTRGDDAVRTHAL